MLKLSALITLVVLFLDWQDRSPSDVETEIRRLEQLAVQGVINSDTSMLRQIWAPGFMVNTPRNDIAQSRADVFRNMKGGLINYSSFERNIEKMQIHKKMVVTMGNEVFVAGADLPDAKKGQSVKRRFTNVWVKEKGGWMQVARHASVICAK